ncbi:unnamed protein product [Meloidogyne enterolobii]|uniref:Uncharacterized protein n=1 Tax=Meloidogyne enterolobii TaxID=390850 RepID=A0ACB1A3I6_MELEN
MVNITLATKKQIIEASATGLQRKGKIFKKIEKKDKSKKVSSRPVKYEKIEAALRSWIKSLKKLEIPLTGPLLKEKAKDLAQEFNIKDFKASNGWLCGFQERYSISLKNFYRKQPMELGEVEELLNAEMCCSEDELVIVGFV